MTDFENRKSFYDLSKDFESRVWVLYDVIESIGDKGYHDNERYAAALREAHKDVWRYLQDSDIILAMRCMTSFFAIFVDGDLDENDYDARGIAILNARPDRKITYSR